MKNDDLIGALNAQTEMIDMIVNDLKKLELILARQVEYWETRSKEFNQLIEQ